MSTRDQNLFPVFSAACGAARESLWRHMEEKGLREKDGWRIYEFTRQVGGHTQLVMRPVHRELNAPPDLECLCSIDEPGSNVSSECRD